jgi:Fe-Mn family superoxide dismutase
MAYTLPELSYSYDALEPYIDARTMEIHHSKHHGGYVTKVNAALEGHAEWSEKDIQDVIKSLTRLPDAIQTAVRNNGGGHFNHTIFWSTMGPGKGGDATADVGEAINTDFGSFAQFKEAFSTAAANRFGSGWAWLVLNSSGKLAVVSTPNQDNPISEGHQPILGLDVWEHAYYLKYQNRRPEYIENWWNVVDWDAVNERYLSAR